MIELLEGRFFKTFTTVLEEKSFSRAAEKLGYVQSTVTTHIQLLEQVCKQKLFHRLPRGVKPTDAGERLAKFAYQYIHLGRSIEENMNEFDQPLGTVSIRMPEPFFITRLSPFLRLFTKDYPNVKLRAEAGFQQDILNQVLDYAADFGIVPRDPQRHDVHFYPLVNEKLIFILSNELAEKVETKDLDILNDEMLISFGTSCVYTSQANKVLQESGIYIQNSLELPSLEMIKRTVKYGIGFALVPEIAVQDELAAGDFKVLSIGPEVFTLHGLIVHKDRELSYAARLFQSLATEYFASEGYTKN